MLLAVVVPALALLLTVLMAAPAWAVTVNVRVQGLNGEVCAPIQVNVPENLTVTDSHGAVINCGPANPLGALYMAAQAESFPFVTEGGGAFLNSIAGVGGPPDWSSWWLYAVNGCIPMVGVLDWELREGDRILFFEAGGDPMAPWVDKELVVVGPKTARYAGHPRRWWVTTWAKPTPRRRPALRFRSGHGRRVAGGLCPGERRNLCT